MKFKVGEVVALIADGGHNCGKFTIDEIVGDRVWFKPRPSFNSFSSYGSCRPKDLVRRLRKLPKPGEQLEWDW